MLHFTLVFYRVSGFRGVISCLGTYFVVAWGEQRSLVVQCLTRNRDITGWNRRCVPLSKTLYTHSYVLVQQSKASRHD